MRILFIFKRKPKEQPEEKLQHRIDRISKDIVFALFNIGSERFFTTTSLNFLKQCDCHRTTVLPGQYIDMAEQMPEPVDFCQN